MPLVLVGLVGARGGVPPLDRPGTASRSRCCSAFGAATPGSSTASTTCGWMLRHSLGRTAAVRRLDKKGALQRAAAILALLRPESGSHQAADINRINGYIRFVADIYHSRQLRAEFTIQLESATQENQCFPSRHCVHAFRERSQTQQHGARAKIRLGSRKRRAAGGIGVGGNTREFDAAHNLLEPLGVGCEILGNAQAAAEIDHRNQAVGRRILI